MRSMFSTIRGLIEGFNPAVLMMARIRNEQLHEERRAQIIGAAASVFREKGFHAARTEDICARAGLSAGAVFRYFKDKREIIDAIVSAEIVRYDRDAAFLMSREGLEWLVSMKPEALQRELVGSDHGLGLDSWLELARNPERLAQLVSFDMKVHSDLAEALKRGQSEGWVQRNVNPEYASSLILTLINGLWLEQSVRFAADAALSAAAVSEFIASCILIPRDS